MLVGSFSVGFLADRYGRKKMLLVALAINGIAGWVSVFAPTVRILIASRFFAGIGAVVALLNLFISNILCQELVGHCQRFLLLVLSCSQLMFEADTCPSCQDLSW